MINDITFPKKYSSENNQQYAYRALFQAIMHLDLKPGQQISDTELAEALNISRTPVREAVLRLIEMKLIDVHPQKSSSISRINLDYVDEGVFLRNVVEPEVFKEAIKKSTQTDLSALRENLSLQRLRMEEKRYDEYIDIDDDFHRIIYMMAGKSRSWDAIVSVTTHLNRMRRLLNLAGGDTLERGFKEHFEMYDIIAGKKDVDINDLIYQHVTRGNRVVLPKLRTSYPEYFEDINQ